MLSKTTSNARLISQLDAIIHSVLRDNPLPLVYENKIRIGYLLIRETRGQWTVYDTDKNKIIAKTHYKKSALVLAKNYLQNPGCITEILYLDGEIFKHTCDIEQYEYAINHLANENKIAVRMARMGDSENKREIAERKLQKYFKFA